MKTRPLQFTIRKMRSVFLTPRFLGGLAVVVLVLGISGPFQTFDELNFPMRLVYWAVICILTLSIGFFISTLTEEILAHKPLSDFVQFAIGALATALAVSVIVVSMNVLLANLGFTNADYLVQAALYAGAISLAVSSGFRFFSPAQKTPTPVRILARVPAHLRGPLLSLSVQDHYTEVRTVKGTHLVLIRLSDAIAEAGDGLQIHRSHWVATRAIEKVERRAGKVVLTTLDGVELPVSRSFTPAVKAAGLLI